MGADRGLSGKVGGGKEAGRDGERGGVCVDLLEGGELGAVLRHDPFAELAVGDRVFLAQGVKEGFATGAEAGFERRGAVVEAGVDYLGALVGMEQREGRRSDFVR